MPAVGKEASKWCIDIFSFYILYIMQNYIPIAIRSTTIYILYMVVHKLCDRILEDWHLSPSFSLSLSLLPSLPPSSVPLSLFFKHMHTDPTLNTRNVQQVMEGVRKWKSVGNWLSVPYTILYKISAECSSDDEKISTLANYVVTILPNIDWDEIAAVLYEFDEERAMERAKSYLHTVPGE